MSTAIHAEPAFVGRELELGELKRCLESVVQGKGTTVFISGEAGSGKTRLTNELLKYARRKAVTVLSGWCLSNAAVPYFPFFEAFNAYLSEEQYIEGEEVTEVSEWLKGPTQAEKTGKPQAISPQVWKDQTFVAVAKTLTSISTRKPVILLIDDIHWADSASLALIHYIARAMSSEKVLLLATFRSEQLTADAEGRPHPLVETLRLMKREDLFREIKLSNLSQAYVSELSKAMLGGDIQQELAEKLMEESQGNVLFVVESLRMLHERGGLVQEHKEWRMASGELGIPDKIKDIILQRLSMLLHNQRRILEAASTIGIKFDTELLALTLDQGHLEVADALGMIARANSLVCSEGEQYRFDHARSRDAIYDEISPALKRAYHGKVAEKLESAIKGDKLPLSELAYHFAQAGNKEKAVNYSIAAGQDELAKWSNAQAIEHFTYALQNLSEGESAQRRAALEGLGDAYAANGMFGEATKTFDKLVSLETGRLRLRAIRKAMDAAYFIWGASDLLLEYSRKAEELGVDDRLEMARILVNRGRAFGWAPSGSMERDLADSDAALQVFEEEYSLADVGTALWRSGVLCVTLDLQEKGLGELLRSVSIFREIGDVRREVEAIYWTAVGFASCFLYPEARREFANVLWMGEKLGMFAEISQACTYLARFDEWDGKLAEAVSNNLKSIEYINKTDAYSMNANMSYGGLIRIYSKLGDLKQADEWSEKSHAIGRQEFRSHWRVAPEIAWTAGVRLAAKGQWNESNQAFERLFELLRTGSYSPTSFMARAMSDYAWALEKQGAFKEAKVKHSEAQKIRRESEARFEHGNLQAHLMARRQTVVGVEVEMRLDLVNVGRKPILIVRIEGMVPNGFKVTNLPSSCSLQNGSLTVKEKSVGPFQVEAVKLKLEATKAGSYSLNPEVLCVDDLGKTKAVKTKLLTITVELGKPAYETLPGRVATGYTELDRLLLGGIPREYAVVLAAPSTDEREQLAKRFLETGAAAGETTFNIASEVAAVKALAEKYPSTFFLFLCNPQADSMIQDSPNVCKLKGVESLTDIDIALTKAFRTLDTSTIVPRRICIEIVSDVLLQHHAVMTRRWLSALLPTLKSRGFTVLATVNPRMHPPEEFEAVLGLFDGEIRVSEKETPEGTASFLKIKKMTGQKYLKDEIRLAEE